MCELSDSNTQGRFNFAAAVYGLTFTHIDLVMFLYVFFVPQTKQMNAFFFSYSYLSYSQSAWYLAYLNAILELAIHEDKCCRRC